MAADPSSRTETQTSRGSIDGTATQEAVPSGRRRVMLATYPNPSLVGSSSSTSSLPGISIDLTTEAPRPTTSGCWLPLAVAPELDDVAGVKTGRVFGSGPHCERSLR